MLRDRFDHLLWIGLLLCLAALAWLLAGSSRTADARAATPSLEQAMERQLAEQARIAYLQQLYQPVEELQRAGRRSEALLRLQELRRRYPGEAHGHILAAFLLWEEQAWDEALAQLAAGIRLNGDYLDPRSPLSRREQIDAMTRQGLAQLQQRARLHPDNPSLAAGLKRAYYLQSRLAGGCE